MRSAVRVLQLLEALNDGAAVGVADIQARTGLPKPTIVRLLQTLISAGYARQLSRLEGYTVTERVLRLAAGFRHTDQVVAVARGYLDAFTAEHKWTANIQTQDRGAMRSRYTTRSRSPLDGDPSRINRRFPILSTAHGQVYLAFCGQAEREMLLAILKASKKPADALAREPRALTKLIADVRREGYSLRNASPRDQIVGFAVPVLTAGGAAATIGMRYFESAMRPSEAVRRYLRPLQHIASGVSAALARGEDDIIA